MYNNFTKEFFEKLGFDTTSKYEINREDHQACVLASLRDLAELQLIGYEEIRAKLDEEEKMLRIRVEMLKEAIEARGAEYIPWKQFHVGGSICEYGWEWYRSRDICRIWQAFSECNSKPFYIGYTEQTQSITVDYLDYLGKKYFMFDDPRWEIVPGITDVAFGLAEKMGVLVQLDEKYKEVIEEFLKNPTKYVELLRKHRKEEMGYNSQDIVKYLLDNYK